MTTEEERKAAAEKLESDNRVSVKHTPDVEWLNIAIHTQILLTRTEKRLEVAEGLLRDAYLTLRAYDIRQDSILEFLHPPAEGE